MTTEGQPWLLSPAVDLTALRIIQEALTNVTKHADTRKAQVQLSYGPGLLYARDRAQLVVIAYQTGLIRPPTGDQTE